MRIRKSLRSLRVLRAEIFKSLLLRLPFRTKLPHEYRNHGSLSGLLLLLTLGRMFVESVEGSMSIQYITWSTKRALWATSPFRLGYRAVSSVSRKLWFLCMHVRKGLAESKHNYPIGKISDSIMGWTRTVVIQAVTIVTYSSYNQLFN